MAGKHNLSDVTFVIPIRVDSEEREANLKALLTVLLQDFITNIIVLEADKVPNFHYEQERIEYHFVNDIDPVFHRTKYINQLLKLATTPIVGIWDADAIGITNQIIDALEQIRQQKTIMAFPYDGRFYCADKVTSNLFRQTIHYKILTENVALMKLMHGYYAVGGAYMVNKEEYLKVGAENENFYGWGPEDAERVRRMEIFNLPVYYSKGLLFHLWHPIRENSWFASREIERKNRKELLKICKMNTNAILNRKL
jgi:predicted glycosyltransferase involved in capsule biosynthesis